MLTEIEIVLIELSICLSKFKTMHKHNRNRTGIYNKRQKYNLSNKKIAELLGYSNAMSFANSSSKERILYAIDAIITLVEDSCIYNKV